jgi:hypothetical protein
MQRIMKGRYVAIFGHHLNDSSVVSSSSPVSKQQPIRVERKQSVGLQGLFDLMMKIKQLWIEEAGAQPLTACPNRKRNRGQ